MTAETSILQQGLLSYMLLNRHKSSRQVEMASCRWRRVASAALALALVVAVACMEVVEGASKKKGATDAASTNYVALDPKKRTGQERFLCLARGRCHYKVIECPVECPLRKPKKNKKFKGCFADCSSRCEATCKRRLPNCNGYGSLCYDPRFVGGDGVMFYFHGAKGGDFALVSDDKFQINAHFIGVRPEGRTRDFTWVQGLAIMFDNHTLVLAATPVAKWDDRVDALAVQWDGEDVAVPTDGDAEWRAPSTNLPASDDEEATASIANVAAVTEEGTDDDLEREVVLERTGELNSVRVTVSGLLEIDVKVVPISEEEDRAHGYRLPPNDAFAHFETQFRFGASGLTEKVEGILGQTYRPDYVSPVKKGVAMPLMGGEDKYRTPSFLSTACAHCRFRRPVAVGGAHEFAATKVLVKY